MMSKLPAKLLAILLLPTVVESRASAATLYASDAREGINNLYALSPASGNGTLVGPFAVGGFMAGLAYDAVRGVMYGTTTSSNQLFAIDTATGSATLVGSLHVSLMHGLAYSNQSGTLYGTTASGLAGQPVFHRIDVSTGRATAIGTVANPFPQFIGATQPGVSGLAVQPATGVIYGSYTGVNAAARSGLITINPATGAATPIGIMSSSQIITGLSFHPDTGVLYAIDNGTIDTLYTVNISTGALTVVGPTGTANNLGLEFAGYRIPEPMSIVMTLIGFGALGTRRATWKMVNGAGNSICD